MIEEWKVVPGYDDWYEVSDLGRVRSWKNGKWGRRPTSRPLALTSVHHGYRQVHLSRSRTDVRPFLVHQLVLLAFVGPRPKGYGGLHRNGDPADNRLENLYYGTQKENGQDMVRHGRAPKTPYKLSPEQTAEAQQRYALGGVTMQALADLYNCSLTCMWNIIRKRS